MACIHTIYVSMCYNMVWAFVGIFTCRCMYIHMNVHICIHLCGFYVAFMCSMYPMYVPFKDVSLSYEGDVYGFGEMLHDEASILPYL